MQENVYITTYGEKYHVDKNCKCIQASKIRNITLYQAKHQKRLPCKICSKNANINDNDSFKNNNIRDNFIYQKKKKINKKIINNIKSEDADNELFNNSSTSSNDQGYISITDNEISKNINNNNNSEEYEDEKTSEFKIEERSDLNFGFDYFKNNNSFITDISCENIIGNKKNCDNKKDINDNEKKNEINYNYNNKNNQNNNDETNAPKIIILSSEDIKKKNMEKINNLILKDKNRYNNIYKRQKLRNNIPIFNDENHKININKDIHDINNIQLDQKSNNIENIMLSPIVSNHNIKNIVNNIKQNKIEYYSCLNNDIINYNKNCNFICNKNDMIYLEESYSNSLTLQFEKSNSLKRFIKINNPNGNGIISIDNYMYKFEIIPLNKNCYYPLKIEVGFKMEYINSRDLNLLSDEYLPNNNNFNCIIASLYDSFESKKNLLIFNKTGIVYVLINIKRGKVFIIGKEELDKRKNKQFLDRNNTNIFFVMNFEPILNTNVLRSIEPVFNFEKKDLEFYLIKINDKHV